MHQQLKAVTWLDRSHMNNEPNYEHAGIFWMGGPAAAGKTTVSRLLAGKYDFSGAAIFDSYLQSPTR